MALIVASMDIVVTIHAHVMALCVPLNALKLLLQMVGVIEQMHEDETEMMG
jgi:hypothetical protein